MENEAKNQGKTNIGETKPKVQQPEPPELDEVDLQSVAAGLLPSV